MPLKYNKSEVFVALLKLGRIEFTGFLYCAMLCGALSMGGPNLSASGILLVFVVALFSNAWGFAHNDLCDLPIDSASENLFGRPLVNGKVSIRTARFFIAVNIVIPFVIMLYVQRNVKLVALLVASFLFAAAYNILSKRMPFSDLLFAASSSLLCLFGGFIVGGDKGNVSLLLAVSSLVFIDYAIFNACATIKDVKNDQSHSAVTAATFCGARVSATGVLCLPIGIKMYVFSLRLLAVVVVCICPFIFNLRFGYWQMGLLFAASLLSICATVAVLSVRVFDRTRIGRVLVIQDASSKLLVPLLLAGFVGWEWCVFLVMFPLVWFFVCGLFLYRRVFSLNKSY